MVFVTLVQCSSPVYSLANIYMSIHKENAHKEKQLHSRLQIVEW